MKIKRCPKCRTRMFRDPLRDGTWVCLNPDCRHTVLLTHASGTPPNFHTILTDAQRAWLKRQPGGMSAALRRLIDAAMQDEK